MAAGTGVNTNDQAADERGGWAMAKVLRCGDLMPGCNAVIEGKDEAEVMAKGAEHAKTAHKMTAIPPDMAAKVKAAIKEKK
jgi:predicted small metal-binding protein